MVETKDRVLVNAVGYVILHAIMNAQKIAQQHVGADVVMHVHLVVETNVRPVPDNVWNRVKRNVRMLLDIHV